MNYRNFRNNKFLYWQKRCQS